MAISPCAPLLVQRSVAKSSKYLAGYSGSISNVALSTRFSCRFGNQPCVTGTVRAKKSDKPMYQVPPMLMRLKFTTEYGTSDSFRRAGPAKSEPSNHLVLDGVCAPLQSPLSSERAHATQELVQDAAKAEPVHAFVVRDTFASGISKTHLWRPICSCKESQTGMAWLYTALEMRAG